MNAGDITEGAFADELTLSDLSLTADDLNGHTITELLDYYDAGFSPLDSSIEDSPGCQIALTTIRRLRTLAEELLEAEARELPPVDQNWVTAILSQISVHRQTGSDVPLREPGGDGRVVITESALRAILRSAGDKLPGLLVGRVRFTGDLTSSGAPVRVEVEASAMRNANIPDSAERLKLAIDAELRKHTGLRVVSVDVDVHDVHRDQN